MVEVEALAVLLTREIGRFKPVGQETRYEAVLAAAKSNCCRSRF
jgi:hypothetical protein